MTTAIAIRTSRMACRPDSLRRRDRNHATAPAARIASDVIATSLYSARNRRDKMRNTNWSSSLSEDAAMAANFAARAAFVCAAMPVSNDRTKHTIARR